MQPVLSLVSIALVSCIVVFLRLLRPERFINPDAIDNLVDFMAGLNIGFFSYFPFSWISRAMNHISTGNGGGYWRIMGLFSITLFLLSGIIWLFQKRYYMKLFDRLNETSSGAFHSSWRKKVLRGNFGTLWKKDIKTFIRTPAQWSQLLIIGAMVMVFILNMKSIPLPHPAIKNVIVFLNLGMAAFIVAGLNSRFTFTALPMEGKGVAHVLASPFDRSEFLRFKLVFFAVPQILIGFLLFFTGDFAFKLDPFFRFSALFFLFPVLVLLSIMALFFGLQIKDFSAVTPQHLIVTKPGISYMLWSLLVIVLGMVYFVRPLFLFYFNQYKMKPVPYPEILIWFFGFLVINGLVGRFLYHKSQNIWAKREFL
jgi:ABC-2 type transport system permease protein